MTIQELIKSGVSRMRLPYWVSQTDYLCIACTQEGQPGPWAHLFSRPVQEAIKEPTPQSCFWYLDTSNEWVPYTGVLDKADLFALLPGDAIKISG